MKKILIVLSILISYAPIFSQNEISNYTKFGIDIIPALNFAIDGNREFDEFEFIYRESRENTDLRVKFGISNYNFIGAKLISIVKIEDNSPVSLKYFQAEYTPKNSYLVSLGAAKFLKNNKLPIYYGMDFNVGLIRGNLYTAEKTISLNESEIYNIKSMHNNNLLFGGTPFLGIEKHLTNKIVLGIEFGLKMNFITGKIDYENQDGDSILRNLSRFELGLNQIINDIVILIKI